MTVPSYLNNVVRHLFIFYRSWLCFLSVGRISVSASLSNDRKDGFTYIWIKTALITLPWSILFFMSPFGHLMEEPTHSLMLGKIEAQRRRGRLRMRWLDSITYSVDMSKLWEVVRTGKPGVLQSLGPQSRTQLSEQQQISPLKIKKAPSDLP